MKKLSDRQIMIIRCAYADLLGVAQARALGNIELHDWRGHKETIADMEFVFGDILDIEKREQV